VSTFIIIARTMETVWRARVVGADGATKAVGGGCVVVRRGGAGVSQEVEACMSCADCRHKDALKGVITRHRARYSYNTQSTTHAICEGSCSWRRFATGRQAHIRRTGRVGEGPQQEAQSGRGPHGKEKEIPVGGNGAKGWSERSYQHKSDAATLRMILLRFGGRKGRGRDGHGAVVSVAGLTKAALGRVVWVVNRWA
jgi:hypothetical protein